MRGDIDRTRRTRLTRSLPSPTTLGCGTNVLPPWPEFVGKHARAKRSSSWSSSGEARDFRSDRTSLGGIRGGGSERTAEDVTRGQGYGGAVGLPCESVMDASHTDAMSASPGELAIGLSARAGLRHIDGETHGVVLFAVVIACLTCGGALPLCDTCVEAKYAHLFGSGRCARLRLGAGRRGQARPRYEQPAAVASVRGQSTGDRTAEGRRPQRGRAAAGALGAGVLGGCAYAVRAVA